MQLGTRWTSGGEPPSSLPQAMREAIAGVDRAIPDDDLGQPRPRWTLTWLERRPIAELDTGVIVDDAGRVSHDTDEDEPGA